MKTPMVIAGPCSAESKEQIDYLAKILSRIPGVSAMRAGLWKPRSLPGNFEGVGEKGLPWLSSVQEIHQIPVATEVILPHHVEQCLKHNIKILWLGARTTVNPFYVNEISKALKGTDVTLMVKNPIKPDRRLWLGAIERVMNNGITQPVAVHRGFSVHNSPHYRNEPLWPLVEDLKAHFPEVPVLLDPSHITGNSYQIDPLLYFSPLENYSGMMIEVHEDPKNALSDAAQQIKPNRLSYLLNKYFTNSDAIQSIKTTKTTDHLLSK